jgi:hypothetical protein
LILSGTLIFFAVGVFCVRRLERSLMDYFYFLPLFCVLGYFWQTGFIFALSYEKSTDKGFFIAGCFNSLEQSCGVV